MPKPPGSATNAVGELGHQRLPLVQRLDDVQLRQAAVGELALDELLRDHADHLAARRERAVGDRAHQPDAAAAVDEPEPARGRAPRRTRAPRRRRPATGRSRRRRTRRPAARHERTGVLYRAGMPRPFFTSDEPPERPGDPAVRRANLRRIAGLFRPYRVRLSVVLGLILISAALGVVPAFLLRGAAGGDRAERHDRALSLSPAG